MVPAYYSTGIRAFTSSIVNVAPRSRCELHDAPAGDIAATFGEPDAELNVVPLYALRARRRGYEVAVIKALMEFRWHVRRPRAAAARRALSAGRGRRPRARAARLKRRAE